MIARLSTCFALAALAAVTLSAAPVRAQAPAQPSPTALLVAKQIVELKGVKQLYEPLIRGVVEKVKAQFMQTNFNWAKDLNEVAADLEKNYAPRVDELVDATAHIYAAHFSEAELKQILAFYQSPVGHKWITEEPKAADESMAYAGSWGDDLSQQVMDAMRAEMKKRGKDL